MPVYGGGGEKCFHCKKTVYAAEKVSANGWTFHKVCASLVLTQASPSLLTGPSAL